MSEPLATLGVIGDPVAHSISPELHNPALREAGIHEQYVRWLTPAASLPARIAALRQSPMRGANITLPHKLAVIPLLDRLDGVAQQLQAVNTIVLQPDQTLTGHNTDAPAFRDSLIELELDPAHTRAVVLGAGGAARAALWALNELGCGEVTVINRSLARAEALADQAQRILGAADPQVPEILRAATLLINATSLGWQASHPAPLDPGLLHSQLLVYDMVYRQTPLLQAAQHCGARWCTGLEMLVRQAALAFAHWFPGPPPLETMRAAAQRAVQA